MRFAVLQVLCIFPACQYAKSRFMVHVHLSGPYFFGVTCDVSCDFACDVSVIMVKITNSLN